MNIETMALKFIKPYKNNAKLHPKEQIEQIKRSIEEFGFNDPIAIDEHDTIIEGHGRYIALLQLGHTEAPVIRLSHLNDTQKKAYIIAHNKLTLNSEFDMDLIIKELDDIKIDLDPTITGFDLSELDNLLDTDEVVEDEFDIEVPQEPKSKLGDLWLLDGHRVLCGDSTSDDDVNNLTNGNKVDMVFTDPPYGMNLDTDYTKMGDGGKKHNRIIADDKQFNAHFILNKFSYCNEIFLWGADYYVETLNRQYPDLGSWIIWDKYSDDDRKGLLDGRFGSSFETCWSKQKHKREIARVLVTTNYTSRGDETRVHPTQKPVSLAKWFFDRWGSNNDIVLDLFGGSGSTLIASEQVKRQCYIMELDPKYIDVIVKRFESFKPNADIKLVRDGNTYSYDDIFGGEA